MSRPDLPSTVYESIYSGCLESKLDGWILLQPFVYLDCHMLLDVTTDSLMCILSWITATSRDNFHLWMNHHRFSTKDWIFTSHWTQYFSTEWVHTFNYWPSSVHFRNQEIQKISNTALSLSYSNVKRLGIFFFFNFYSSQSSHVDFKSIFLFNSRRKGNILMRQHSEDNVQQWDWPTICGNRAIKPLLLA